MGKEARGHYVYVLTFQNYLAARYATTSLPSLRPDERCLHLLCRCPRCHPMGPQTPAHNHVRERGCNQEIVTRHT